MSIRRRKVKSTDKRIKSSEVGMLTREDEALYEVGKDMIKGSIVTGRDFCKFMISISAGSIPTYLLLLGFVLPRSVAPPASWLIVLMIPPFLFLVGALIFIAGYFPHVGRVSLQLIKQIREAYRKTIKRRNTFIILGLTLFMSGSILAIVSILSLMILL